MTRAFLSFSLLLAARIAACTSCGDLFSSEPGAGGAASSTSASQGPVARPPLAAQPALPLPPPRPTVEPGVSCPEVKTCVDRYAKPKLGAGDVKSFIDRGINDCFAWRDKERLAQQGKCLPMTLGKDARNGQPVEMIYACSAPCRDYGTIVVRYAGTSEDQCCRRGGHPLKDPAGGGYRGCTPPESPLPRFDHPRPDGVMAQATRDPCAPKR